MVLYFPEGSDTRTIPAFIPLDATGRLKVAKIRPTPSSHNRRILNEFWFPELHLVP
jgi:hypothetical protein